MRFDTVGKNKGLTEEVVNKLSSNKSNHNVSGFREDNCTKISSNKTAHGKE